MSALGARLDALPLTGDVVDGDPRVMSIGEIKILLSDIARSNINDTYARKDGELVECPPALSTRIRAAEALARLLGAYDVPETAVLPAPTRVTWSSPERRVEVARQALQAKNRSGSDE